MSGKLHINKTSTGDAYDIYVDNSFERLTDAMLALPFRPYKICIVTDSNVGALYAFEVESILNRNFNNVYIYTFPAGEDHKNLDTVSDLYRFLIRNKFDRKSALVALGGGVTGDLTGFAAATFLRGIPFIQIPTSLLADTDSSIGGKTGVDLDEYKNMVGAFKMPALVYINISVIRSLSDREFSSGMAEIIKHALIRDKAYYQLIKDNIDSMKSIENDLVEEVIYKSLCIKAAIVEEDPKEQGVRALLNFGHTLGHAIERYMDFKLTHGECVALGSLAAMEISRRRGYISDAEVKDAAHIFASCGLPCTLDEIIDKDKVIEISRSDKKMAAGQIKFILLKAIGEAYVDTTVTDEELLAGLDAVLKG